MNARTEANRLARRLGIHARGIQVNPVVAERPAKVKGRPRQVKPYDRKVEGRNAWVNQG